MYLEDKLARDVVAKEGEGEKLLLLGDSIMLGYAPFLKRALGDALPVVYPEENCRNTAYLLTEINRIVASVGSDATLVQLNCGHWDAAHFGGDKLPLTDIREYERNLVLLLHRLYRLLPSARFILATTTPMHPEGVTGANPRTTEEIEGYNRAVRSVAKREGVATVDIFNEVSRYPASFFADYCHLTPEGYSYLAEGLADWYLSHLS